MASRFEVSLGPFLSGLFQEKLRSVLKEEGFRETLRIPEPQITEFQRGSQQISLQAGHVHAHRQAISIESEELDVGSFAASAARETILAVSTELLDCFPDIDTSTAREQIATCLVRVLA